MLSQIEKKIIRRNYPLFCLIKMISGYVCICERDSLIHFILIGSAIQTHPRCPYLQNTVLVHYDPCSVRELPQIEMNIIRFSLQ